MKKRKGLYLATLIMVASTTAALPHVSTKESEMLKVAASTTELPYNNKQIRTIEIPDTNNIEVEKVTDENHVIFTGKEQTMYLLEDTNLREVPAADYQSHSQVKEGEELTYLGVNPYNIAKVVYENQIGYIDEKFLTNNKDYIFKEKKMEKYAIGNIGLKETLEKDSKSLHTYNPGDKVTIIGNNDSKFYKVKYEDIVGYISKDNLIDDISSRYPYLTQSSKSNVTYYASNMVDGKVSSVNSGQQTDSNVYLLAQLLHCEANGQGYDGYRAVATVVVNRLEDGYWGNSIHSVIFAKGQFTPALNGSIYGVKPTQEELNAARDVLMNGYRSFPKYVLYFQSISDGYFGGHRTYMKTQTPSGIYKQYFSYKPSDV